MNSIDALIVIPRLKVQNANTISSPITWGFPAVTAILGFVHALERKLIAHQYHDLKFLGVGIICHNYEPQTSQTNHSHDALFCLTRNPLEKDGSTSSFSEEGRAHIEISLVIAAQGKVCYSQQKEKLILDLSTVMQTLRLAGGSILPAVKPVKIIARASEEENKKEGKKILRQLMPGFVLLSRKELLAKRTEELQLENPNATSFDALLEFASLNFEPPDIDDVNSSKEAEWTIQKKSGWIFPIPVGYSAISQLYEPGTVLNARDNHYPFCFAECIYSLGQWLSPHRIKNIEDIFWHYRVDAEKGLYQCINDPSETIKL